MREALLWAVLAMGLGVLAMADDLPWVACFGFWVAGLWSADVINIIKRRLGYTPEGGAP